MKYPFVKQEEEKDCSAAALLMIIKYYKGYVSLETLKDLLKITKNGTSMYHLAKTAEQLGFDAAGYKCNFSDITKNNVLLPCVANVVINNAYSHFVVIYEINYQKNYLIIGDPAKSIKKISFADFSKIFTDYLLVLYPVKPIPIIEGSKSELKKFLSSFFKEKSSLRHIIFLSIIVTLFSIISSFYIEFLINSISNTKSFNSLLLIFIIFSLIFLIKNISEYIRNKVLMIVNSKLDLNLTLDTYENVLSLPYHYYRNRTTGDIVSRMNDLANIKNIFSKAFLILIVDLPLTLIAAVFLFLINKILFLLSILVLVAYILVVVFFHNVFEKYIMCIQNSRSLVTSSMVESISGFETVKGLKIKNYVMTKFKKLYVKFLDLAYKYQNYYYLENIIKNIISDFGFIIIMFIGSILVLNNMMTLGSLFTFNALIIYFLEPIKNILSIDIEVKEAKFSLKRIEALKLRDKELNITNDSLKGNIEFKNLSYSFDDVNYILKDVNLVINNNDKTLILGPSGSGKSTLCKMLMKYYKVMPNSIIIDGKDINDYGNSSNIKYINQIETLFTDTLYNNLTLGNNVLIDDLNEISSICELTNIVNKDSLGYNQLIEENGFNLSGGERQRIVLARTLLTNFDILIIDEGLNQVDIDMERRILKRIMNKYGDKTIIVISHRLNNRDLYNKIIKFKNGKVSIN